jgi:Zn-finger nucleic acid-binding protein
MTDDRPTLMCYSQMALAKLPSTARTCAQCGRGIWVSLAMTPRVDQGAIRPLCPLCMKAFMDSQKDVEFEIAPEQADELARWGVLGAADQMVTALNARYRTGPRFRCPRCGLVSWNPKDVEAGYCGHCHEWTRLDS